MGSICKKEMLSKLKIRAKDWFGADPLLATRPPEVFVKGINLGGSEVTIEGYRWDAYKTALTQGLAVPHAEAAITNVQPTPYVKPQARQMLNSVIYRQHRLELEQTLPNGTYALYLWVMENYRSDWHSFDVVLAEQTIATGIGKLALGQWMRYGGYSAVVSEGVLRLAIVTQNPDIDAHLMGISIFSVTN